MAQFTQRAIMESFMRLVKRKPLDKITVKDIVEDCEITRNTFYYHFQDIYDLTAEVFRSEFAGIIQRRSTDDWRQQLWDIATFAQENRSAVLHIYTSARQDELARAFDQAADGYLLQVVRNYPQAAAVKEEDIQLIAKALRYSLSGAVRAWLDKGMRTMPGPALQRAIQLFSGTIESALQRATQLPPKSRT